METRYFKKFNGVDDLIITPKYKIIIKKIMKLKSKNVDINNLCDEIKYKIKEIEQACQFLEGKDYIMTITSGNDSKHMKDSLHYKNKAIDIRSNDMCYPVGTTLRIRKILGKNYDVILENDHIHIEYQIKKYE